MFYCLLLIVVIIIGALSFGLCVCLSVCLISDTTLWEVAQVQVVATGYLILSLSLYLSLCLASELVPLWHWFIYQIFVALQHDFKSVFYMFLKFLFRVLCVCISWHDIALKNYIENRAQLTHLVGYVCVRLSVCVCM